MIYYEVHENGAVLRAFRRALANAPAGVRIDPDDHVAHIRKLEELNNMTIHGTFDGKYWETTGFEFSDEQSLTWFLLRWGS